MPLKTESAQGSHDHAQQHPTPAPASPGMEGQIPTLEGLDPSLVQRSTTAPGMISPREVRVLQRTVGNQSTTRLIQKKLSVSAPGDRYEQEADRMAETVVRGPATVARSPLSIQRASQTESGTGGFDAGADVESALSARDGAGSPLSGEVRNFMEPRFGADFSGVRIHTDGESARLNRQLSAQAFTHGNNIYMGEGKYNPGTESGKVLLAHELTHVVQQTGSTIHRWFENEHKSFGDLAASKVSMHDWEFAMGGGDKVKPAGVGEKTTMEVGGDEATKKKYQNFMDKEVDPLKGELMNSLGGKSAFAGPGVGVQGKDGKYMSFGDATMLGGDYFKTAEATGTGNTAGLAQAENINPLDMSTRMTYVAATNTNHFFPLAGLEWETQFREALGHAAKANASYQMGKKAGGDNESAIAMRHLGVALHFLQDTFASGHQYPRALDDIDSVTAAGIAAEGVSTAKTYHDALCVLPKGINMLYGGGKRFHGDTKANGDDAPVVTESYRAMARVLSTISGKPLPDEAKEFPKANPGPDVAKIMDDPEAGPLWASMTKAIEGKLATAKGKAESHWYNSVRQTNFTTSAGTPYSAEYFQQEWDKLDHSKDRKPTSLVDKLVDAAMRNQSTVAHGVTRGTTLTGIGKSTNSGADDEIVALIEKEGAPRLTHNQTVMVLGVLLTGVCTDGDEQAILKILDAQTDEVVLSVVREITPDTIDKGVDGEEWDQFLALWASRGNSSYNPGADYILKEENDDAARLLIQKIPASGTGRVSPQQWEKLSKLVKDD